MQPDDDDLHHMLSWNERLPLLARAQFRYMEQLRELGFDAEQAFTLVRDWSQHSWAWSVTPPQSSSASHKSGSSDDAYLLDLPEGFGSGGAHRAPGNDEAGPGNGAGSVWSDGTASPAPETWPGEDEVARARRQRRRRWGFRADDRMDDAA